jgi:HK97 family phage portal protein
MGLWDWLTGQGATPNSTVSVPDSVGPTYNPGDPNQLEFEDAEPTGNRMAAIVTSPWDGWPAEWGTPAWNQGRLGDLIDSAWGAIDLNASVLSAMPVYLTRDGVVVEPREWMANPDPMIYSSWAEFAKQLFWDYQLGEAFVLPMAVGSDGKPSNFRVIPPWQVNVEMGGGGRVYNIGSFDVTDEILHIRYKSATDCARGVGPLESGKYRLIAAGVLARYAAEVAQGGGIPYYWIESERRLSKPESDELKDQWWRSRTQNPAIPPVLSGGITAKRMQYTPAEVGLVDLAQFNESRIVTLLGVPPFLMGLPSGGDSMTYSTVAQLFDFHDRASVKTKATHVMQALSGWAVQPDERVELNRDEYTRPSLGERVAAYKTLIDAEVLTAEEVRGMERFNGGAGIVPPSQADPDARNAPAVGAVKQRDVAETLQKVYLAVDSVITSDEARQIANKAGADLPVPGPDFGTQPGGDVQ